MTGSNRKSISSAVIGVLVGIVLVLTSCGSGNSGSTATTGQGLPVPPSNLPKLNGSTFTYWYGLIFSPQANATEANQIKAWGSLHHINVDAVPVNQNDLVTKVSAALIAHTMPDALDMSDNLMVQLKNSHNLQNLTPLYNQVGDKYGGWLPAVGTKKTYPAYGLGIPYGGSGNLLIQRTDILANAGYKQAPTTWAEIEQESMKAQHPPATYGMGWPISNVGDAEAFVEAVFHDYGVRIANNAGTTCTLDTPATREAVSFLADAYSKNLFPPGNTVWDGAGNNLAYQGGKVLFTEDTGSIYLYLAANDHQLVNASALSTFPGGPKMRVEPVNLWSRVIPTQSKNAALAESLIQYLSEPAHMEAYYKAAIYGPVLKDYAKSPVFNEAGQDPIHAALKQLTESGTYGPYPDVENAAYAQYSNTFQASKIVQAVVVNHLSVSEAVTQGQEACQRIYRSAG